MKAAGEAGEREMPGSMRGMTLLELLVALSIFAVVGSALYPVITGAIGSRKDATARYQLVAEARTILDRLEQDITSNIESGFAGTLPPRFVATAPSGHRSDTERIVLESTTLVARGVTPADAFVGGEDVAALAVDRGDQAHVLWRIDSSGRLLRQQVRPPRIDPVDWSRIPVEVVSERATLVLEFYEPQTWLEAWDSRETGARRGRAPMAVRTTVNVGDSANEGIELVSTVVLPVVETASDVRRPAQGEP